MMRLDALAALAVLGLTLLAPRVARAQEEPGQLGVGAYLGTPFGLSAKYIIDPRNALDLAIGAQGSNLDVHFDVLTHFRDFSRQPARGRLAPYLGLGLKIEDQSETLFGVRFVGGAAYTLPSQPLEVFAELAPVVRMTPSFGMNLDGGVGARWYFGGSGSR